jgi:hypothetical protein
MFNAFVTSEGSYLKKKQTSGEIIRLGTEERVYIFLTMSAACSATINMGK